MEEIYDFMSMGKKYAEDFYKDSSRFADKLEKDFGEVAKIKFQYGISKSIAEFTDSIFENTMKETSTVTKKAPKKQTKAKKTVNSKQLDDEIKK